MYKRTRILLLLDFGHSISLSVLTKSKKWRTMWCILKISTDINNELKIHTFFYIFMSVRTSIEVLWVVIPCIFIRIFVRWRPQVNPKRLRHSASLYNVIPTVPYVNLHSNRLILI
jgi:hypothetical protein